MVTQHTEEITKHSECRGIDPITYEMKPSSVSTLMLVINSYKHWGYLLRDRWFETVLLVLLPCQGITPTGSKQPTGRTHFSTKRNNYKNNEYILIANGSKPWTIDTAYLTYWKPHNIMARKMPSELDIIYGGRILTRASELYYRANAKETILRLNNLFCA